MYVCLAVQTAVKQELKKANAAAAVTQMSVAGMGGEEQGAAARGTPDSDGTGTAARKSEKVSHAWSLFRQLRQPDSTSQLWWGC